MNAMERLNKMVKESGKRIVAGLDPTMDEIFNVMDGLRCCSNCNEVGHFTGSCSLFCEEAFKEYCYNYIDAMSRCVIAIKINSAFFEQYGKEKLYFDVAKYAKEKAELFVIGDVKRADIGNTSKAYANAFLGAESPFDAITINPYFGTDGVKPFFDMAVENEKGVFVLVKTSNPSSAEIQNLVLQDGRKVYEAVADMVNMWGISYSKGWGYFPIGAVVGATHPEEADKLRKLMPNTFFLVPGYGAQGTTAKDITVNFDEDGGGAVVNSSRAIMQAYKKNNAFSPYSWERAATFEATRACTEINDALNLK